MKGLFACFVFLFLCNFVNAQAYKVDTVRLDTSTRNIKRPIHQIQIIGNKVTKEHIILRELTFKVGDTLSSKQMVAELEQSKKNLLNTSLFNFVAIEWAEDGLNRVTVIITLTERWYLFPSPIFEIDDINFNSWWLEKDFSRVNYGLYLSLKNFRGRKEILKATFQLGYTENINLYYEIPYINKQRASGLGFRYSYKRNHEIVYITDNNKRQFYKNKNKYAQKIHSSGISYYYRKRIFDRHSISLDFFNVHVLDTIRELNSNYLDAGKFKTEFFTLNYNFVHDERDSKNYPLKGNYFTLNVRKYGLGIINSKLDLLNFSSTYKRFWELGKGFYLAGKIIGEVAANNKQPYLLQNGLGYSEGSSLRSYEYYVVDGQNIGIGKLQLRYQLVKPAVAQVNFIPTEKFNKFHYAFYLGIFSDLGYVDDNTGYPNNRLANELLYSYGIGLDFVTYYDMVLRTEFALNKFGESGLFLHFVAPI